EAEDAALVAPLGDVEDGRARHFATMIARAPPAARGRARAVMYADPVSAARGTSWADAARALRARQWLHFTVLPLAAMGGGAPVSSARLGLGVGVAAALLAYAYGANAIADRGTDASLRKNVLAGVVAAPLRAAGLVASAGAIGFAGALLLGGLA